MSSEPSPTAGRILSDLLARPNLFTVPFERSHVSIAREAFARYGNGRGHPARLNFGDCLIDAVAKRDDLPLLCKGADFARTDIAPALP